MKIACHFEPTSRRSSYIAKAMAKGARKLGLQAEEVVGFSEPAGDVGVAYGWGRPALFEAYRRQGGHFVYLDLGWWNRKPPYDVLGGYHKVVVDAREPSAYFRGNFATDRMTRHGLSVAPWRPYGRHVLVAGMSEKSAKTRGFGPLQWEMGMIEILRRMTDRPIVYRPKPSWTGAKPIYGTIYSAPDVPITDALRDCHLAVTLHSNVAVDALQAGVPVNVQEGVASEFSTPLAQIEVPRMPPGRAQLLADIAWCQWNGAEMADGSCWRHLLAHTPLKELQCA